MTDARSIDSQRGTPRKPAAGTPGVISWAGHAHGLAIARTMGMVTFALFSLFFSIERKNERDSAFSLGTFSGKTFLITTSVSFVLLALSTVPVNRRSRRHPQSRTTADRHDAI